MSADEDFDLGWLRGQGRLGPQSIAEVVATIERLTRERDGAKKSAIRAVNDVLESMKAYYEAELAKVQQEQDEARSDDCETAAITIDRLRAGSQFLIDRLSELEIPEDLARDWFGHVDPAIERLRDLLPPDAVTKRRA